MNERTPLALVSTASNSRGFEIIPRLPELPRDFRISFRRPESEGDIVYVEPAGPLFPEDSWNAVIRLTPNQLFGYVSACRDKWQKVIERMEPVPAAGGGQKPLAPLKEQWDLSDRGKPWGAKIAAELAEAGEKLWWEVFENHANTDAKEIGQRLKDRSRERELVGVFVANDFFVPWGLLYTAPPDHVKDGMPEVWHGFWGYRHIIQHTTRDYQLDYELTANAGVVKTSFNYDVTLGQDCLDPQIAFFKAFESQLKTIPRTEKAKLRLDLESGVFDDQIAYFCCHGKAAGIGTRNLNSSSLKLDEEFTADELDYWAKNDLQSHPIVFINACEGGQMTTLFYETIGAIVLKRKATALLGSQLDIPKKFAPEYMRRVLQKLCAAEQRQQLGVIVRQVAREFATLNNPIGLTYSLYRGMDAYISWNDHQ